MEDTPTGIEARVCEDITRRQQLGIRKYGTTLEDAGLDELALLQHAYEETLDLAICLKGAIERRKRSPGKRVNNQRITKKKAKLVTTSASIEEAPNLTALQKIKLEILAKGCAIDANPREWSSRKDRDEMERLVGLGLIRKTPPMPWAKHGAYVKL